MPPIAAADAMPLLPPTVTRCADFAHGVLPPPLLFRPRQLIDAASLIDDTHERRDHFFLFFSPAMILQMLS